MRVRGRRTRSSILDALDPAIKEHNALVARQNAASQRCNAAVSRFNALINEHNHQPTAADQQRFKKPMQQAEAEVAKLRVEHDAIDRRRAQSTAKVDDLHRQFRALAAAYSLAVSYTLN